MRGENSLVFVQVTVKGVEKESGLERFVPVSLVETMKKKVNLLFKISLTKPQ